MDEIIDVYEEEKIKRKKQLVKVNKLLLFLLPLFLCLYVISLHSNYLINYKMGMFNLILFLLSILYIITFYLINIKELKLKIKNICLLSIYYLFFFGLLFLIYSDSSPVKEKLKNLGNNYSYIANCLYGEKEYQFNLEDDLITK